MSYKDFKEVYSAIVIEDIVKQKMINGESILASEVMDEYVDYLETNPDLMTPDISEDDSYVRLEESSAADFNDKQERIRRDIDALYLAASDIGGAIVNRETKWGNEIDRISRKLLELEDELEGLLLVRKDTEGYFAFAIVNLTNSDSIDFTSDYTDGCMIDTSYGIIALEPTGDSAKINTNELTGDNVKFEVISRDYYHSQSNIEGSKVEYAFRDTDETWLTVVRTTKPTTVTAVMRVSFDEEVTATRLAIKWNANNRSGNVVIHPQYSTDGYTWNNLPIADYIQAMKDSCVFTFPSITFSYLKIGFTKDMQDESLANDLNAYYFGGDISLYTYSYDDLEGYVQTGEIYFYDEDNNEVTFNKAAIEVCESMSDNTKIEYWLSAGSDTLSAWTPWEGGKICPLNRSSSNEPSFIKFDSLVEYEKTGVTVSQEIVNSGVNTYRYIPAKSDFNLLRWTTTLNEVDVVIGSLANNYSDGAQTYMFNNPEDRILNLRVESDVVMDKKSLEVWRNTGTLGSTSLVRGNPKGWGYVDPYYSTTIYVEKDQIEIDFGNPKTAASASIIDGIPIYGKISIVRGRHDIKVHKDNWLTISNDYNTLAALIAEDKLYPYNHKYLIEGYDYGSGWSTDVTQVYVGVDLFAEFYMEKVSVFDMISNIASDGYKYFAIDSDLGSTIATVGGVSEAYEGGNKVFVIKADITHDDLLSEEFLISFGMDQEIFNKIKLRIKLTTDSTEETPTCSLVRIKVSN